MTLSDIGRGLDRSLSSWLAKVIFGAMITAVCAMFFNMAYWTWQQTIENGRNELRTESKLDALSSSIVAFQTFQDTQRSIDGIQTSEISSLKTDLNVLQQRLTDHVNSDVEIEEKVMRAKRSGK